MQTREWFTQNDGPSVFAEQRVRELTHPGTPRCVNCRANRVAMFNASATWPTLLASDEGIRIRLLIARRPTHLDSRKHTIEFESLFSRQKATALPYGAGGKDEWGFSGNVLAKRIPILKIRKVGAKN